MLVMLLMQAITKAGTFTTVVQCWLCVYGLLGVHSCGVRSCMHVSGHL
jgi:hypothetical protein